MDQRDRADKIEPALAAEPIENAEAREPTDATDKIEPAEPMDKIEPAEPIDRIDPLDPMLRTEPEDPGELVMSPHPRSICRSVECLLLHSDSRQAGTRAAILEEENTAGRLRQRNKASAQTVSIHHRDDGQLNLPDTCPAAAMPSCAVAASAIIWRDCRPW